MMLFARQNVDAPGRTNLREIANRSVALRSYAIGRARLSIALDAPATGRFLVNGNAGTLQLAVLNLIVNAEQALAGQKGGAIRVAARRVARLRRSAGRGQWSWSGQRRGDELFESFFTTRSRDEASGLGLSVARLIAEQHGGTLTLEASGRRRMLRDAPAGAS